MGIKEGIFPAVFHDDDADGAVDDGDAELTLMRGQRGMRLWFLFHDIFNIFHFFEPAFFSQLRKGCSFVAAFVYCFRAKGGRGAHCR